MSDNDKLGGAMQASADNEDSDEYDPSATFPEDLSVTVDAPGEHPPADLRDRTFSPAAASGKNSLPAKPAPRPSATSGQPADANPSSVSTPPVLPRPRMRGGFEVDDDAEEEEDNEDSRDVLDVYGAEDEVEADPKLTAPVSQTPVSNSESSTHANGLVPSATQSPTVQAGATGPVSSAHVSSTAVPPPRASTVTPQHVAADIQVQPSSVPQNVTSSLTSSVPKGRLAHDVVGILEDRIRDDPRGDLAAWLELISELKIRNKQDEVRRLYDRFFITFPMAVGSPILCWQTTR